MLTGYQGKKTLPQKLGGFGFGGPRAEHSVQGADSAQPAERSGHSFGESLRACFAAAPVPVGQVAALRVVPWGAGSSGPFPDVPQGTADFEGGVPEWLCDRPLCSGTFGVLVDVEGASVGEGHGLSAVVASASPSDQGSDGMPGEDVPFIPVWHGS